MQRLYINFAAFLLFTAINLVCRTLRFNIRWKQELDQAKNKGNVLFAVWHQATFAMFYLYRHNNAVILVTEEMRGQILGKCAQWMGYQPITMPSQKQNFDYAQSLVNMLKLMRKGCDAVIAVDGPIGPLFEVKPGVFYIAGKAKVPIIPIGIRAPWKLTLFWRWDKYFIPLLFSPVRLRVGRAIWPDRHAAVDLKKNLKRLSQ